MKLIADASRAHRVELTVCGEMAHQREYIPFLLGIGVQNLSVSTSFLYETQQIISQIDISDAEALAEELLSHSSVNEIERSLGLI